MLITVDEYFDMGFNAPSEEIAEKAVKRAGYIINALTDGRAQAVLDENGEASSFIRQAVGFQAEQLVGEEQLSSAVEESVSIGDFSYKQSTSQSADLRTAEQYKQEVISLLRTAGVLYKGVSVSDY